MDLIFCNFAMVIMYNNIYGFFRVYVDEILSSANRDTFTPSFLYTVNHFYLFFLASIPVRASNIMLNRRSMNKDSFLVPYLRREAFTV